MSTDYTMQNTASLHQALAWLQGIATTNLVVKAYQITINMQLYQPELQPGNADFLAACHPGSRTRQH
jgi:hypothetical protein